MTTYTYAELEALKTAPNTSQGTLDYVNLGTNAELVNMAARLAESELRANQLEAQFKTQCEITTAALDERAKMFAPSASQINTAGVYPKWEKGPSAFKAWCAQWFGGDADEAYLAKAVMALPMLAAPSTSQPGYVVVHRKVLNKLGYPMQVIDTFATPQAAPSTSLTEAQGEHVNQGLLDALEEARTGLLWYQDAHPESVDGSDTEVMERIDAAIEAAHNIKGGALCPEQ